MRVEVVKKVAPYGSWRSPITADLIVGGAIGVSQPAIDRGDIYWIEMRPAEGGRQVIVKRDAAGHIADVNPKPFNARTRVHEYGGGDYLVSNGIIYFSNFADQRLYRQTTQPAQPGNATPQPITPEAPMRYAEPIIDVARNRIICVREDHSVPDCEAVNTLVSLKTDGNNDCGGVLVAGNDFYSSPRLSPDGRKLVWLTWNHPNMPWDGTELWQADVETDGSLSKATLIAGGLSESIFQPEWSPDGRLYFVSDRNGWWNLYRVDKGQIAGVTDLNAEFGVPQWVFSLSSYAFESSGRIVAVYYVRGMAQLAVIDTDTLKLEPLNLGYTDLGFVRASSGQAIFRAGSPTHPPAIVRLNLENRQPENIRVSNNLNIDSGYLSVPEPIEFPTSGGLTAHGFFYPPQNSDYREPDAERPPLLVKSHGGPTSAAATALSLNIQYWTSRGIAVLDVNYGGSSGYGREYRERLQGQWGIVDVDDCANGAKYLVSRGDADPDRLMITGGSAGGYTTLCALTFKDTFKAGASHYGVSDAEALTAETHKFESRYLDKLFGPYPECRDIYHNRSPINFIERISCPVIFFQGLEDRVVPPNQAEMMVEALRKKGVPVGYVAFAGEQHGFRQAQNIKRSLEGELYFYSRVFGFELPEAVEPIDIRNLN
jgi:dipeptidyl aminopeptidase/acylaminoacyl peptidase